jgi:hypothetical protein
MGSFWTAARIPLILVAIQNVWALESLDGKWVDAWTAMPQLTEPANLPPPPFVSCFWLLILPILLTTDVRTDLVLCFLTRPSGRPFT